MRIPLPPDLRGRPRPDRAMAVLRAVSGAYLVLTRSAPPRPAPARGELRLVVVERRVEAQDVVGLRLVASDGAHLPRWRPGAHLDVGLPSGLRRQYSLTGSPEDRSAYRIAVRRILGGGGGSLEVHGLQVGDTVTTAGPRTAFPFVADGPVLLVAGGIGITPIAPMVRTAASRGLDWHLVYTGRTRASMPFLPELTGAELAGRVTVAPDDECGPPTAQTLLARAPAGGTVYCCGPPPMLAAVRAGFAATGARELHMERFSPPPVVGGRPFRLVLARSGHTLDVPADRTALDAVREVLPRVAHSCRQGFCGTCRVRVAAGEVEHRDRSGGPEMALCVSRAAGDELVVDL